MADQLLRDTLAAWPDRWHYPDLAIEVTQPGERFDTELAALLLLRGLAEPRSLTEGLSRLIDDGEFASAEEIMLSLLDQDSGQPSEDDWTEIESRLARVRAQAAAAIASRLADLEDRAAALNQKIADPSAVLKTVPDSRPRADALLDQWEAHIEADENAEREALRQRLGITEAAQPQPGIAEVRQWSSSVEAAIEAGEFSLAKALLAENPDDFTDSGPLTVPPSPFRWPWPDRRVAEVLNWYDHPETGPGPEFERYRPSEADVAAAHLRRAMLRLHERVDGQAVQEFAVALTAFLGESAAPAVTQAGPGFSTTLFGLHDARLPHLPVLRPEGVALWVTPDGEASLPPDLGAHPVICFRPVFGAARPDDPNAAFFDISDLLRVMAPDGRLRRGGVPARRINLLRLLLPQLDSSAVLGEAGIDLGVGASRRDSLAWLFDLVGLAPDRVVLEGLLYDSGAHPIVLRCLLDAMLRNRAELRQAGRVTPSDLRLARQPEVRQQARAELLKPLESDPAAAMVLRLALWQFDSRDVITPDQLVEGFGFLNPPPKITQRFAHDESIALALGILTARGLMRRVTGNRFKLPAPGLLAVLGDGMAEQEQRAAAFAAMASLGESIRRDDEATAARLGGRITHLIGHRVDNDVLSIGRLLAEVRAGTDDPAQDALLELLENKVRALGGGQYVRLYEEALEPSRPVEVLDLVRSVIGDVEWHVSQGMHLRRFGDEESWVLANPLVLREAIRNLVINSAKAIGRLNRVPRSGAIAITVRRHPGPGWAYGVRVAPPCVAIEVADDGSGFNADDLKFYRYLADTSDSPGTGLWAAHPADYPNRIGSGIPQTIAWLRDYGGYLQVLPRAAASGGASVTAWLPLVADPTRSETP